MLARIVGYVRAHHIGLLALFVALGGTSYAAIKLPANSVGTKQLKKNAVTLKKIKRSTRRALKGQKGDTGIRGATGATGATGPRGLTGPQGPGASRLKWSVIATTSPPPPTTLFTSGDGLTVTAQCEKDTSFDINIVRINFGATGTGATSNATWTLETSLTPNNTSTHQDGAANGTVTVDDTIDYTTPAFHRLEGQAILRNGVRVVSIAFHGVVDSNDKCEVDGTATPAT